MKLDKNDIQNIKFAINTYMAQLESEIKRIANNSKLSLEVRNEQTIMLFKQYTMFDTILDKLKEC